MMVMECEKINSLCFFQSKHISKNKKYLSEYVRRSTIIVTFEI